MAYPFLKAITAAQFRQRLLDEPAVVFENDEELGPVFRCVHWNAEHDPVPFDYPDAEPMMPSTVRSICDRLELDPKDFGFTLG